jgi:hypothetical protein
MEKWWPIIKDFGIKGTGDLQTVRALLGHVQIESTARSRSPNQGRPDSGLSSL